MYVLTFYDFIKTNSRSRSSNFKGTSHNYCNLHVCLFFLCIVGTRAYLRTKKGFDIYFEYYYVIFITISNLTSVWTSVVTVSTLQNLIALIALKRFITIRFHLGDEKDCTMLQSDQASFISFATLVSDLTSLRTCYPQVYRFNLDHKTESFSSGRNIILT